jgi:hypothetical protein
VSPLRRTLLACLSATILACGLLTTPASGATGCTLGTPRTSTDRISVGVSHTKTLRVTVKVSNCSPSAGKNLRVTWWAQGQMDGDPIDRLSSHYEGNNTYTYTGSKAYRPGRLYNDEAGLWSTELASTKGASVYQTPIRTKEVPDFRVLRASRLTLDVWWRGSSKPPKGYPLYVNPYLERANWEKEQYRFYGDRKVEIQFRKTNGSYRTIGRATADGGPSWFEATVDGCYRAVWTGNGTTGADKSKADCIDVQ